MQVGGRSKGHSRDELISKCRDNRPSVSTDTCTDHTNSADTLQESVQMSKQLGAELPPQKELETVVFLGIFDA